MYLRQTNKWKEFALQEGVEDIGLPSEVAFILRQMNNDAGPVSNKHLTWIGTLVKAHKSRHFYNAPVHKTIIEEIIGRDRWPDTPEGEEAWGNAVKFFSEWYINHSGVRGLPTLVDLKSLRKSARKMLKKTGVDDKVIKELDSFLEYRATQGVRSLQGYIYPIMTALAEDPAFYDEIRDEVSKELPDWEPRHALRLAADIARDVLTNPAKAKDRVLHTFDNGYFWYDIRSHACDFEAKKMGHCGRGDQGQLYSLRSGDRRRNIKPMITIEFADGVIYQIKAKANAAPPQDMYPYIDWFIENMGVEMIEEKGSHSSDGLGFAEMLGYLKEKHPDVKFGVAWITEATELIDQYAPGFETDSQTDQEVEYPSMGSLAVSFMVKHQAFWPVKDVIVDEDTTRLRWEIKQDAQSIVEDTLYPNPRVVSADVFPRGVQDSKSAMLRIELEWMDYFEPDDPDYEKDVEEALARLTNYLDEMQEVSEYLVSPNAAPEGAEFDYNGFWEGVQERLEALGVYRDVAGEEDRQTKRDQEEEAGQLRLPLEESRIIQRWSKIIK